MLGPKHDVRLEYGERILPEAFDEIEKEAVEAAVAEYSAT